MSMSTKRYPDEVKDYVKIDPDTGKLFWKKSTGIIDFTGKEITHINHAGYICFRFKGKMLRGHRVAWYLYHGEWPKGIIDHINQNKLDNRLKNLRVCCQKGNQANRKATRADGLKGITRHRKKWAAGITKDYKRIYLGLYNSKEEAAKAYDEAAKQLFGEYARLNYGEN